MMSCRGSGEWHKTGPGKLYKYQTHLYLIESLKPQNKSSTQVANKSKLNLKEEKRIWYQNQNLSLCRGHKLWKRWSIKVRIIPLYCHQDIICPHCYTVPGPGSLHTLWRQPEKEKVAKVHPPISMSQMIWNMERGVWELCKEVAPVAAQWIWWQFKTNRS